MTLFLSQREPRGVLPSTVQGLQLSGLPPFALTPTIRTPIIAIQLNSQTHLPKPLLKVKVGLKNQHHTTYTDIPVITFPYHKGK